jgi:hypothetical protein
MERDNLYKVQKSWSVCVCIYIYISKSDLATETSSKSAHVSVY